MDFQITRRYPCSYLPGELARSRIVVTDDTLSDSNTYAQLIQQGYRRSGSNLSPGLRLLSRLYSGAHPGGAV